ncbi:beta-glucosidase [Actinoalloteichus sp. AHMU CJ021]|uniref:Beta-glucosidase n=1 Tax=Actinoalloteichus caeruleus DSM 43889 TaxID=1120930 RepID=A0ABT1JNH2_ACTCY|nr:GH1 family beta-glucosidase [Actinoalloteichus caeruleus]AUS79898.1 beta-glucosidase [Actinoalloteichus sp. AHMU CJ021]MCP2334074.1 beta-glucosidase [Actinoalloteichus caeruleus DSM 43889]
MTEHTAQDPAASSAAITFPEGFLWGASTASFQIEGSTTADGRTDSIWDVLCRKPGAVANADTGDPAADHYRRVSEDVALMADLGLATYRFSVAWPRVRPDGGSVNQRGLDFYRGLVDELLERDIVPWITLYHWDLPQALEERGGWTNRDTAYRFAEYADTVVTALGDRVPYWTTLNEPFCAAFLGYASGEHAPGRTEPDAAVAAVHHLLVAHGLGTALIRARRPDVKLGITLNPAPIVPADPDDPVDVAAARRVDLVRNRVFLDPLFRGEYPEDAHTQFDQFGFSELVRDGDLKLISQPIDLLGVNFYHDEVVSGHGGTEAPSLDGRPTPLVGAAPFSNPERDLPRTAMGWPVDPRGLTDLLLRLHREYPGVPLYVTENGAAYLDTVAEDGQVHDEDRTRYLDGHLRAVHDAIEQGVDLRGYCCWSLLDNFEWAWGYDQRFGVVHVDYKTQERTVKDSGRFFARVIKANGIPGSGD